MLDAAEFIELAVFQRHVELLKVNFSRVDTLYDDEASIIGYFENRIQTLKERLP